MLTRLHAAVLLACSILILILSGGSCGPESSADPSADLSLDRDAYVGAAQAGSAPRLFFTDLESGPTTGGEGNLGAFVSLYGEGFGSSRGSSTVTIGGREVARYVIWSSDNAPRGLDMIVVQLGNVTSGDVVVTVNGLPSNPLPFTVRAGRIYFVSPSGSNSNDGSFERPWATIVHAKNRLAAGDIAYIRDGVNETAEENFDAALSIETGGAQGAPKALVAYPGARATIGSTSLEFSIRVPNTGVVANDWVIAKLTLRGRIQALDIGGNGSSRWRIVGNDISCPVGDGQTGCFAASLASYIAFLGNDVHGISKAGRQPSKQYHAVYFTTDSNHVDVGWNHIHDNNTCRAVQFHSSPLCVPSCGSGDRTGFNQYDLIVHDNLIHGDVCDGINFATVDPSRGVVRAYNNVIYDVGRGPAPPDGDANYAGIYVAGATNTGSDGRGEVEISNNTFYDCGARRRLPNSTGDEGAFSRGSGSLGLFMSLKNNIVYATQGEAYISPGSTTSLIRGSNNLWFGAGSPPSFLSGNIGADPRFANLVAFDFRLQSSSPAINAGTATGIATDFDGVPRPQGSAIDIGAHEFGASSPPPPQPPPSSGTFYVSTSGNDSNDGSQSSPWRTIQHALDVLQPGQTVFVRGGTYDEYIEFRRSGRADAPITLAAFQAETVILDGRGLNWRYAISLGGFDNLAVRGLRIRDFIRDGLRGFGVVGWGDTDNITVRDLDIQLVGTPIKFAADGSDDVRSNITIENVTASQYDGGGIDLGPGPVSSVIMRNVRFTGPSGGNDTAVDGIAVEQGDQILVEGVTMTGHAGDGVDLKADNVTVRQADVRGYGRNGLKLWGTNTTAENNLFVSTRGELPTLVLVGAGPYNIRHNLFAGGPGHGYTVGIGPDDPPPGAPPMQVNLHGNIFYNPTNTGTLIYFSRVTVLQASNNLYWAPQRTDEVLAAFPGGSYRTFSTSEINSGVWAAAMQTDQGSRHADAMFVNPGGGDYQLRSGSPAIDVVPPASAPSIDLLGRPRPQGAAADIGPYEFTGGGGGGRTFRLSVSIKGSGRVVSNPSGINCPSDCEREYAEGTSVSLSAIPASGWRLANWTGACSGRRDCVINMEADASVRAKFKRIR